MIALLIAMLLSQADGTIVRRRDVSGTGSTVVPTAIQTTNGNATYFVTSSGNDSANTCISVSAPCLTIQGALNKIPKNIYHQIDVSVGAGSFAGFAVEGFHVHASNQTAQPYLNVSGTLNTATVATGTASGTLTAFAAGSGTTFAVFTDSGQTWTINDLKGKLIQITSGTGFNNAAFYVITSNTATAITALAGTGAAAAASSGYTIVDWGTTINSFLVTQTSGPLNAALNWASTGIRSSENFSEGLVGTGITIQKLAFAFGSGSTAVTLDGSFRSALQWLKFGTNVTTGVSMVRNAGAQIGGSYFSANSSMISQGNTNSVAGGLSVIQDYFENGSTGIFVSSPYIRVNGSLFKAQSSASITVSIGFLSGSQISTSRIDGSANGILVAPSSTGGPGMAALGVTTTDISNCTAAGINLTSPGAMGTFDTVTGSANLVGWNIQNGAKAQIGTTATLTGTTEISIDGSSTTLATMRGATPKLVSSSYFSIIYQ